MVVFSSETVINLVLGGLVVVLCLAGYVCVSIIAMVCVWRTRKASMKPIKPTTKHTEGGILAIHAPLYHAHIWCLVCC